MERPERFVEIGIAPLVFSEGCIVVGGRMPVHCIIKKPMTFLNHYKTAAD